MLIVYEGPHDAVYVDDVLAKRGEPVEVDDALASRLLEQSVWVEAPEPPARERKAAKAATNEEV